MIYEFITEYDSGYKCRWQYSDLIFAIFARNNFKEHCKTVSSIYIDLTVDEPSIKEIPIL